MDTIREKFTLWTNQCRCRRSIKQNVIYVGTDNGIYASLDGGITFYPVSKNFPFAPVHDLVVHPRDKELVIATHGRSIYKADVKHLQQLTEEILSKPLYIFEIEKIWYNKNWGNKTYTWSDYIKPQIKIPFYSNQNKNLELRIASENGLLIFSQKIDADFGLNYYSYNLTTDSLSLSKLIANKKLKDKSDEYLSRKSDGNFYLIPGKYFVEIINGKEKVSTFFEIAEREQE